MAEAAAEATERVGRLDFDRTSTEFIEWFSASDGTRLNPKVQLRDLRDQNAGRAAGMFSDSLQSHLLTVLLQLPKKMLQRRRNYSPFHDH